MRPVQSRPPRASYPSRGPPPPPPPGRASVVAILQGLGQDSEQSPLEGPSLLPAATGRRYLVFIRAGNEALHRRLIQEDPERNWDCCVSWYGAPADERLAEYYCGGGTGFANKLDGFMEFWKRRPRPWRYRYIALLDDDVYLRPGELSRFFSLCDFYNLYLSQPALEWFTLTTLNALVRNPACVLRRVSFVEVMAPCFSATTQKKQQQTNNKTRSTWGVDWAWGGLLDGHEPLYVVDA